MEKSFVPRFGKKIEEGPRSFNEEETLNYLKEQNIPEVQAWEVGQTVLVVLEDIYRGDNGPFRTMIPEDRPSVARIDTPSELDLDAPRLDPNGRTIFYLGNEGGQVDYYALDPKTKEGRVVKTTHPYKNRKNNAYIVHAGHLFEAADNLFPKSVQTEKESKES